MYVGTIATAVALFINTISNEHQQPGYKRTSITTRYSMIDTIKNSDGADGQVDPNAVQESQIRKMTRLAIEYQAVNLSQGA